MAERNWLPSIAECAYVLFHSPFFTAAYGTALADREEETLDGHLRSFTEAAAYPPNRAYIGSIDPRRMPERPWYGADAGGPGAELKAGAEPQAGAPGETGIANGPFGAVLDERRLYGLLAVADSFDLVTIEEGFAGRVKELLSADPVMAGVDLSPLDKGKPAEQIGESIAQGALPLEHDGEIVGCVKQAHPSDVNLSAHTILENLSAKATGAYAALRLLHQWQGEAAEIEYIIEVSEEACGDMNQRGGGNFAKAIGEVAGLKGATGSDVRSFCAGPVHGLLQAASLVAAGTFSSVMVVAGGTTAKLGMNGKKHIDKGIPILEDCMGGFAVLVGRGAAGGLSIRTDAVGRHRIGTGASPQAVIGDLIAEPLYAAGLTISDVEYFAPELQNPEITENAGAGNVTEANLKMIAALAVMKKEIERGDIPAFIGEHGFTGWAPTQGHIPSGVPALGWFLKWAKEGELRRCMIVGKGSLFLGRMTNLFDGVSLLLERSDPALPAGESGPDAAAAGAARGSGAAGAASGTAAGAVREETGMPRIPALDGLPETLTIGLTVPGSESGEKELYRGAEEAIEASENSKSTGPLEVRFFGEAGDDPKQAHTEMERALQSGEIHGAVTFHYPFPLGCSTVGKIPVPGSKRELFLATTTGTASTDRVSALILNVINGVAAAKACGVDKPKVGLLNLEGAASAYKKLKSLQEGGYDLRLASSVRNEPLLRGNDLLSGDAEADVVVCDSLTGNTLMKIFSAYSTAGRSEVVGSGYGAGLGAGDVPGIINIISRASSSPVVRNALLYNALLIRGGVYGIYRREVEAAEQAGLREILIKPSGDRGRSAAAGAGKTGPAKKTVDTEIEGLDVLEVDAAVEMLLEKGMYAEAGMGCSGPVIMLAGEDKADALRILKEGGYL